MKNTAKMVKPKLAKSKNNHKKVVKSTKFKKTGKKSELSAKSIKQKAENGFGNCLKNKKLETKSKDTVDDKFQVQSDSSNSDSENSDYIDKFFDSPGVATDELNDEDSSHESDNLDESDALSDDCLIDTKYKKEKVKRTATELMDNWEEESLGSNEAPATDNSPATEEDFLEENFILTKKPKKQKKNNKITNGSDPVNLESQEIVPYQGEENVESSDNIDWDDVDYETLDDDEEVEEEWTTDTDYSMEDEEYEDYSMDSYEDDYDTDDSMHSFHEEDCESVSDDDLNGWSTDSEDYVPDVEDKYVKPGEAVLYDPKSDIELNFSDSSEPQIREIPIELEENSNDSCPQLIPLQQPVKEPEIQEPKIKEVTEVENTSSEKLDSSQEQEQEQQSKEPVIKQSQALPESGDLRKIAKFYDCKDLSSVVLKLSETVHFNGILVVKPLINNIEINGYEFQNQEAITTTSISHGDYFLNLTPVIPENQNLEVTKKNVRKFLKNRLNDNQIEEILNEFNYKQDVLLFLEPGFVTSSIRMLEHYSSYAVLPSKQQLIKNSSIPTTEAILRTKFFAGKGGAAGFYQKNAHWDNIEFTENVRVMVAGGKNVGKSGLSQYLINKNVTKFGKVLLVDLDIGQPICSLPQTISATLIEGQGIFGRGCLNQHVRVPDKCILYGDKNVMISPFRYVRCVQQLVEFCESKEEYRDIPWVINTMGYQKGFGLQLMCLLCRIIQPTDFVMIQHRVSSLNFQQVITESLVNNFQMQMFEDIQSSLKQSDCFFVTHVLDSIVNANSTSFISHATEKRKIMMLVHLSRILNENSSNINDIRPYCTSMDKISLFYLDDSHVISKSGQFDVLNGNIVYLCSRINESADAENVLLDCYGLGIVRAVDRLHDLIYLLLPKERSGEEFIQKISVLAVCNFAVPSEIFLKQSRFLEDEKLPYVSSFKDKMISAKHVNKRGIKDLF